MGNVEELISAKGAHSEVIQQAARFCLAEMTDDKTAGEMYEELMSAAQDHVELDGLLRTLEGDETARENLSVAWLSYASDERGSEMVSDALDAAGEAMPVVDGNVIAVGMMYIAYLLTTRGLKTERIIRRKLPSGETEVQEEREFWGPMGIWSNLRSLFREGDERGPSH
jgi:hypothetical protein